MAGGQITTSIPASNGSYPWTIPAFLGENLAGKRYSVYATCLNCSGMIGYASDAYFSIVAPPPPGVACNQASDCGTDVWSGNITCLNGKLYQNHLVNVCYYPGTTSSRCSSYSGSDLKETCPNGCSDGVCNAGLGANISQSSLASISDIIQRIAQQIQEMLKR